MKTARSFTIPVVTKLVRRRVDDQGVVPGKNVDLQMRKVGLPVIRLVECCYSEMRGFCGLKHKPNY